MATAKERTKLSRLELLPAELRTLIYTYLGFPTSKVFDLHCPHAYPSDYTNSSSSQALCPGWTPGSIRLAGIRMPDAKCLVTDPIFINTKTGDEIVRADICGRKGCEFRPLKKDRWMKVATRLMGASSSFYDELSHIMYSGLRIEIGFELSEYAVHTKYKRQHAFEKDERGGNLVHMALSTPLMQRITDIALSDQVGVANTSANVRWTRTFCLRIIQRQVRSLEYIARHCKSLQVLSISMHPIVLQEVHQRQLESISTALLNIFNECKDLRRIELKVHQHKPRCGCYNEYFADQTQHGPAKEPLLQESLDLVSHESVDADTASAWASSVLRDMRRDERLVMVCPYATAWIPEQGRRIMLSTGAVHSIPRRS